MSGQAEDAQISLICAIVKYGTAGRLLQTARRYGIPGGTVLPAKGTVSGRILEFWGLTDIRKEMVLMLCPGHRAGEVLGRLDETFKFSRPNHGVAFIMPICAVMGARSLGGGLVRADGEAEESMYQSITVIVDKGKGEQVIEAATRAGSRGGTILGGRGAGLHETSRLFAMQIEPEKEIVLILAERDRVDAMVESIRADLRIDEPGKGILYVQRVEKALGLYK